MKWWIALAISKNILYFRSFRSRTENIVIFAFTYVCYGDFCMDLYSVDSDEALKRWSEAMKH